MATWENSDQEELYIAVNQSVKKHGKTAVIAWLLDFLRFLFPYPQDNQ